MAKKLDFSIIRLHFICYCLLRLVLILPQIGNASASSGSKEEEDAVLLHLPKIVGAIGTCYEYGNYLIVGYTLASNPSVFYGNDSCTPPYTAGPVASTCT